MLDEDKNWAIDVPGLRENLQEARKHCDPRIMVVINPGNPTGKKIRRTLYDVQGKYIVKFVRVQHVCNRLTLTFKYMYIIMHLSILTYA